MSSAADPFADLKARHRDMWASFAPTAAFTTPVAAHLVEFSEIKPRETVLDVGTGTGVVAITAARKGASVTGLDLTPALLDVARENSRLAGLGSIQWLEGDDHIYASCREFARTNHRECLVIVLNPAEYCNIAGLCCAVRRIEPSPSFRTSFVIPSDEWITLNSSYDTALREADDPAHLVRDA